MVLEIICDVLFLLSGLGVFMYGMHVMSQGLETTAGKSMQRLFARLSNNRFAGVGIGAVTTAIVQSSSATSVMVIGFVNAGIMTLGQATAILMGANIGTTVTAILVSLQGINLDIITYLFMALAVVGVFMTMFSKKDKVRRIGGILTGIGLIFVGLEVMSIAMSNKEIHGAFEVLFSLEAVRFPLVLILLGVVATAAMQSSSVVTAIVITLAIPNADGVAALSLESALFVVLGSNIGTCVTALLASSGATKNAKRAAIFMLLFNVFGVVLFTAIVWPLKTQISTLLMNMTSNNVTFAIALFHVSFNVMTMLMLIGFNKHIVRLLERMIKDKPHEDIPDKLYYLDKRLLSTPQIAVGQTTKEILNMAHIAERNFDMSVESLLDPDLDFTEDIAKRERELNYLNKAITNYLVQLSSENITKDNEALLGSYYHVISDIERIGDHAENFNDIASEMRAKGLRFTGDAKNELMDMYNKIKLLFKDVMYTFQNRTEDLFGQINNTEESIDDMQKVYEQHHVERLKLGNCSVEAGMFFNNCTTDLERVADHLTNIAYSIKPRRV